MEWNYNVTLQNRKLFSKFIENFSLDQLNTIPDGYRNSVFWNIAHTIVTQQLSPDRGQTKLIWQI